MAKKNRARRGTARRERDIYTPLDEEGFPILDAPGLSLHTRYQVAVSRYTLAVWLAPFYSRIRISRHIYLAPIVDDVLRHLHREYEIGKPMSSEDLDRYFERYAETVERSGSDTAWDEHAERLLVKYGSGFGICTP